MNVKKARKWIAGPWDDEPDRKEWVRHGLVCLILRMPKGGHLCGYVGIPKGVRYDSNGLEEIAHGGLTYGGRLKPGAGVCEEDCEYNWEGFDCHHAGDMAPYDVTRGLRWEGSTYRTMDYVEGIVNAMADYVDKTRGEGRRRLRYGRDRVCVEKLKRGAWVEVDKGMARAIDELTQARGLSGVIEVRDA